MNSFPLWTKLYVPIIGGSGLIRLGFSAIRRDGFRRVDFPLVWRCALLIALIAGSIVLEWEPIRENLNYYWHLGR